jgi:hypothetical protein
MTRRAWTGLGIAGLVLAAVAGWPVKAQNVLQYGFETRDPIWVKGFSDAPFKELVHKLTEESAHNGQRSEQISVDAEQGTFIHYTYDIGKAPIADELNVSLWVKANRPGVQLLCRVVLPRERDPRNLEQPLTTLVRGDAYQLTGRWQQLTLRQPSKRLREQQQLLRAEQKRDIVIADAYVDRLVLNVYGGPGRTDVYTDDLEVGPLEEVRPTQLPLATPSSTPPGNAGTIVPGTQRRAADVQLTGNQLMVSGQKFFLRAVRHTGTPLKTLHDAGFNTVFLDETTPPGLIEDAVNLGFWIVPSIQAPQWIPQPSGRFEATLASREAFSKKLAPFMKYDAVIFYDLGSNLPIEQFQPVSLTAQAFRAADPMRPVSADVWDGFEKYSRNIDQLMMGVHRWPLMTSMDLLAYRDWVVQRRRLAQPGTYTWTWVQTHLPDWFTTVAYDKRAPETLKEPLGPQPEQIRLLAYTALGAGVRGLAFWSDRFLADSHTGRDRLLALALLNQELHMLEPLLASAGEPFWIDTSNKEIKAAVLRCDKAVLVVPIWVGTGAQFVPGQSSVAKVDIVVPHIPNGCQAWEISPGEVKAVQWNRVLGGTKITLTEFSMTAAVVFTADLGPTGLLVRFQDHHRRVAKLAAQWAHDQAQEELTKVETIETALKDEGHTLPDGEQLLKKAHEYLDSCESHRRNGDWSEAYAEAQRALRPLRIMMRGQWENAIKEMTTPVASPYALSYYTLPRHWQFWNQVQERVKSQQLTQNLLKDGDFEMPPDQVPQGWLVQEAPSLDEVITVAKRVTTDPQQGKQCLMLQVTPKDKVQPPQVLERTFLAIHSPAARLAPGTLVRLSAWVRVPNPVIGTADGAMLFDSAGGEPLAIRLTAPVPKWKKFTLYRRVPESGTINLTMALTGMGTVYFDDVRIEPLGTPGAPAPLAPTTAMMGPAR